MTSQESLEALQAGDKARCKAIVLAQIRRCGAHGSTADEATDALGLGSNSVAPRFVDLENDGLIVKLYDGEGNRIRRDTRNGCRACVYVAIEFAPSTQPIPETFPEFGPLGPQRWRDDG